MVFDGDLHARVNSPAADRLADSDRILPSSFESAGEFAVIGRSEFRVETLRRRTDAARTGLNFYAQVVSPFLEVFEIGLGVAFINVEIGEEDRVNVEFCGVIEQLRRFPSHRADREVIESEFETAAFGALRE